MQVNNRLVSIMVSFGAFWMRDIRVVFSSLLFIFAFLALNLIVYCVVPAQWRNIVLLAFSIVFYAWGGAAYVLLLCGESLVSWFFALAIERTGGRGNGASKALLAADVAILLGLLVYFKYIGFFAGITQSLFSVPEIKPEVILPIGISFYTFQLISYVVDVYRGEVAAQPAYWKLLMYASLFHQCVAGPIVRYQTVADEIDERHVTRDDVYAGVRRFCIGLAKKAVLANACAAVADSLVPVGDLSVVPTTTGIWLGMAFYMLQIYLDFSAYSDMAIGMGRMVGFHYLENFNYPYMAKSVQDFWRRWHISLSSFFRDYVYIPLGGSRCSTAKFVRNTAVVWLLTGFWHGASWNFVLWGVLFLVFLLLEKFYLREKLESLPRPVGHVYLLIVVFVGWILFRFEDFGQMGSMLVGLIGIGTSGFVDLSTQTVFMSNVFLLLFCIIACTNLGKRIRALLQERANGGGVWLVIYNVSELVTPILCLVFAIAALAGDSYNPFIYFRF